MPELSTPLSSFPSRPLKIEEITDLAATPQFDAVFNDDTMIEVVGAAETPVAYNVVLITAEYVSAAVCSGDDETWYRVYRQPRSVAVLTDAYEAVREIREDDELFGRHALTIEEAVFKTDRPSGEETSGYEEGDAFACPICEGSHEVQFHEEAHSADVDGLDSSYLYVECPATRGNELTIEHQASTPSR